MSELVKVEEKMTIAEIKKDTVEIVEEKLKVMEASNEVMFPSNYSAINALKSAWLILQELEEKKGVLALNACTNKSIANALLDMVVQGLSPAKKQCYFIAYKGKLKLQRSYFGTMAVTKRLKDVRDVRSQIMYLSDEVEIGIENGSKKIVKHTQELENIDITKIKGAYVVIEKMDGTIFTEIMNMTQIKQAWRQSTQKYNIFTDNGDGDDLKKGSVHEKFTDQMCLKTVIHRACKTFANTSDDNDILIESFNNVTEHEYLEEGKEEKDIKQLITEEANKEPLEFEKEFPVLDNVIETEFKELTPTTPSVPTEEDERGF